MSGRPAPGVPAVAEPRRGGRGRIFGYHHDLHLDASDADVGARLGVEELVRLLRLTGADFVQADSKGHPGYTSWFSRTPGASVAPGLVGDVLATWRAATRKLGLPLHAHYSGVWDKAAGAGHPGWCVVRADGTPARTAWAGILGETGDKMCPRGGYARELMVPQLLELARDRHVDGFWVDGDIWAVEPCYCPRCVGAWRERGGVGDPPRGPEDRDWAAWWNFTRESFEAYVAGYVEAVHRGAPGVRVCSNWLQTFRHPGAPTVPTDWISGDTTAMWGLDSVRCEARFISTRGKPWDIVTWDYCFPRGWFGDPDWAVTVKPAAMLQQEAAVSLALGGGVQVCDNPFSNLREGQLARWRLERVGEAARFARRRAARCRGTGTYPQVAVLHSEVHARSRPVGASPRDIDVAPVQGAVFALLECSLGVDVLDEWALGPRLDEFPILVAPEQDGMSPALVERLRAWTRAGGRLLVTGAAGAARFGPAFLGVRLVAESPGAVRWVPSGRGAVSVWSARWGDAEPVTAAPAGRQGASPSRDEKLLPWPAAFHNRVGRGAVAWIPFDVFRAFDRTRFPMLREFLRETVRPLARVLDVRVRAPAAVDAILRRKGSRVIVHLVNRSTGVPAAPHAAVVDEVPRVGPVTITVRGTVPRRVRAAFEQPRLAVSRSRSAGVRIRVDAVRLHAAVELVMPAAPEPGRTAQRSGRTRG